ncbi:MAG: hypothetical protein Q7S84_05045 [bacterium]|nr:hypothetical protein [bacterium]
MSLCNMLCSLLIKQGVNEAIVRPTKTDLAAADLFLKLARVRVLGESAVAGSLCEIALHLDDNSSEAASIVVRAVGRLEELVGAMTLDSEGVADIERALGEGLSLDELTKKFLRSKIPA